MTPEPEALQFDFRTGTSTSPIIELFHLQRQSDGKLEFNGAQLVTAAVDFLTGTKRKKHHARFRGLSQDTAFMFRITADGDRVIGSARTGTRTVGITINQMEILNDGDPGLKGDGEMRFMLAVYDPEGERRYLQSYARDWSEGVYRGPFVREHNAPYFDRAREFYTIWMYVSERDEGAFFEAAPPERVPQELIHGELWGGVWASAMTTVQLPSTAGQYRVPFQAYTGPWGVAFRMDGYAHGTVVVDRPTIIANDWPFPFLDFLKKVKRRG